MRDIANEAYEACAVGAIGWMKPDPDKGETLDAFQTVVEVTVPAMERDGLIRILDLHKESHTGLRLVDLVKFKRLR